MLTLPVPDLTPLSNLALPLVVAQVRFDAPDTALDATTLRTLQSQLREANVPCGQVRTVSGTDMIIGLGQPAMSPSVSGFQLISDDSRWQITVMPDSAALETTSFRSFHEDFAPVFDELLGAVNGVLRPASTRRLGIRFVNVLKPPQHEASSDWTRWVSPTLCGPLKDATLAAGVVGLSQQMLLQLPEGVRSAIRSGPVEADGAAAFLLDIDTFSEPAQVWDATEVSAGVERLNLHGVAVFQTLISPDMLAYLRGTSTDESEAGSA